jgi:DNA-binding transcriptional LysR family regulator
MDRLRALQYFVSAADGRSLSAAARAHGVSVSAVAKQIGVLESTLGFALLHRRTGGVAPTAAGSTYLEACRPALEQLEQAEARAAASELGATGTVVLGLQPVIAQEIVTAALPRFHALHPNVQLDVRYFMRMSDLADLRVDVALALGWTPPAGDFVHRVLGATTFVVAASPAYWSVHGVPAHPRELEHHDCLCIRSNPGSVMDLWQFRRGDERASVAVRGWIIADNAHRDMVRDLAISGAGVVRLLDWNQRPGREIARGELVPALTDWLIEDVPPVNLVYPPGSRRIPRVRAIIDWITALFAEVERDRQRPLPASPMPHWARARRPRASSS